MPAPSPLRLDHVVFPVRDVAATRAFYATTLGLPLVQALSGDDWGGKRWLMMIFALGTSGQHLVTVALDPPPDLDLPGVPRDARHCAMAVEDEATWERWKARLVERKVECWEENHGAQRSLYLVDPSGNVLEITTPPTGELAVGGEPGAMVERWMADSASSRISK